VLAGKQADNIAAGMAKADPNNAEAYKANAAEYKRKLLVLDGDFRTGLAQCARRDIVTSHQAFAYLGGRYGLEVKPISGISPDEEPSPQKLAEVAQFVRVNRVKFIFFETLASPKLSETIARETGAKTIVFNPLEGLSDAEMAQGKNYLSVQRENLENLRIALDCK
jgi:zinc transport system substrate-binding protein